MAITDLAKYSKLKEREITPKCSEDEISAYLAKVSILESQVYWIIGADKKNMGAIEVFNRNMPISLSEKNEDWVFLIQGIQKPTRITKYFQTLARDLGYEALDPVFDHQRFEVSQRAGVDGEEALLSHIIMNDLERKDMLNLAINYGVQLPYLQKAKESFHLREIKRDPHYEDIKDKASFNLEKLYKVSNEMTRENIESVINRYNNKKFFMFTDVSCEPLLNYYINCKK